MFCDVLKRLRKDRNLTQQQLADKLGLSRSTIGMYEKGVREPDFETSELIADFFNVRLDDLLGRKKIATTNLPLPQITNDTIVFPVVGNIAAGYNQIAVESWSGDTVEVPLSYLKGRKQEEFFVLRVDGDSMYPLYQNGDKVLILKQNTLNRSGDVGAILYDDEKATLKKVEYVQGEDWLKLLPINPSYPPETIKGEALQHCRVIGVPRLLIRNIEQ